MAPYSAGQSPHRLIKRYMQHAIEVDKIAQTIISDEDLFK